jgi:hypothetical protein
MGRIHTLSPRFFHQNSDEFQSLARFDVPETHCCPINYDGLCRACVTFRDGGAAKETFMQRFFQIGFNKCATTSLYKLFVNSGVPSVKFTGQRAIQTWNGEPLKVNAQRLINKNTELGLEPLSGLDDIQAFFDMEYTRRDITIENFKRFEMLHNAYPDALFLLNTRDKWAWLRSRALHARGTYLRRSAIRLNCSGLDVLNHWSEEFDRHHAAARAFFADKPDNFCEFNIDEDPVVKIVRFAKKGRIRLEPRHWHVFNETGEAKQDASEQLVKALFMSADMFREQIEAASRGGKDEEAEPLKFIKPTLDPAGTETRQNVVEFQKSGRSRSV